LQIIIEIALTMEKSEPACVSTYNAFLQWKEHISLELTIGARSIIGCNFHNKQFAKRLLFLLSKQNNHQNTYLALANETQKNLITKALTHHKNHKLEEIHTQLETSLNLPSKEDWLSLISSKIDALHSIEKQLINSLGGETHYPSDKKNHAPHTPKTIFGNYENLIRSLQLFSEISEENLQQLLQYGQIRDFGKGKLLFLEGEPANRLYIVLRGWIKIFKGTVGGEETILQIPSSGDTIMESAVFLNSSFPVSAQVISDATLLSLPAPILREQIKNNNKLALNLLATMSYRSQGLIRQIKNARLKTVDERIGWFLLKQLLEQGNNSCSVELPYDKSLIASYLDMRRETFSRALKRMKEKGFKVENDTVIIPHLKALCEFCDDSIAHQCALHGTAECPNPQQCDEAQAHCVHKEYLT
jgi:CRP-like cAMP-binding protein